MVVVAASMYEVIPGILEKEWSEIERKIELVRPFAKTIHIDIVDGKFAPNTTFLEGAAFQKYAGELFLELHMMVEEPVDYLKPWADAGFKRFLGHIEKMSDQAEFVAQAQLLGEVGLALDGPTPLSAIKVSYEDLDAILIYTAGGAGFSGPPFVPDRLEKIKQLRAKYEAIPIEIDGGVNDTTIVEAKICGATRFVSTSFLFKDQNPQIAYQNLAELLR